MSLSLRYYPDPALTEPCTPIAEVTNEIRQLATGMRDLMVASGGVGIAAPQVGHLLRMFVVDIWWPETQSTEKSLTFINPVVSEVRGRQREREGCLSIPNVYEHIDRYNAVRVDALDLEGKPFSLQAQGYLAVAIQHEADHLDGITFLKRMGPLARKMALKSLSGRASKS